MDEQKSFPVRYMVRRDTWGDYFVVDTLAESMKIVCMVFKDEVIAHRLGTLLNESEGYRYDL